MGHTTDYLLDLAKALEKAPNARELDALLSTGELISASLMTVALQSRGFSAKSFTGAAAGMLRTAIMAWPESNTLTCPNCRTAYIRAPSLW